ncbi:hypothetical protein ACM66B_006781 [Microbotryomycetes sp. NB124-2]
MSDTSNKRQHSQMNSQRAHAGQELSGSMRKRQRVRDQRTIATQHPMSTTASINHSTTSTNSTHGPQSARVAGQRSAQRAQNGLPPIIEVDKFVEARNFEIAAMVKAMKSSKEALTQRAFQSLPRHLRRRAASHNVRRLPSRLRVRARQEVPPDSAKPKPKTRNMLGKKRIFKFVNRADVLKRRQRFKTWLETHMWHAKRMHMINIWGHRLATKPTMKAFRSSYRASKHGVLVHDASYYQYITLSGTFDALGAVLSRVCDSHGPQPASKRYCHGQRECATILYKTSERRTGQIGPVSLIWDAPASDDVLDRKVLLRVHPAMAQQAASAVRSAALETSKRGVTITLHEKEFLTFEVTGKRATEVVKSVLKPTLSNDQATKEAWNALDPERGPEGVPQGLVIGLQVYDPRLSFPPKLDKQKPAPGQDLVRPSGDVARIEAFWSPATRSKLRKPTFKKRQLDERRSANIVPGTRLSAIAQDDRIPVLLVQRTLQTTSHDSDATSPPQDDLYGMYGWTLMIPSGWGMPFWNSLVFTNSKAGGLEQRQQQSFESGTLDFPKDYVCSKKSFREYELAKVLEERGFWQRKPKAKRVNFDKLGTEKPWTVDVVGVCERMWSRLSSDQEIGSSGEGPFVVRGNVAQRCVGLLRAEEIDATRCQNVVELSDPEDFAKGLCLAFKHVSKPVEPQECPIPGMLRDAIVHVKVEPVGRGKLEDCAMLYWLDDERKRHVLDKLELNKGRGGAGVQFEDDDELELCEAPSPADVCGRVTSGGFSLSRGRGFGIGFVPLLVYLKLSVENGDESARRIVLVRNPAGQVYRAARISLM